MDKKKITEPIKDDGATSVEKIIIWCLLGVTIVILVVFVVLLFTITDTPKKEQDATVVDRASEEVDIATEIEEIPASETAKPEVVQKQLPEKIDVQPTIDSWVNSTYGRKAIIIYDLDRDEIIGQHNPNEYFGIASLYKLFVVYEGYRRIARGEWNANEIAGYTGHTILECLDLSIRESDSICAETIWIMIGRQELDEIVNDDFGITGTTVSNIASTPSDIMKIMKIFYEHKDINDETLLAHMKDSFLNQPTTTYNWRQGLPSGFSANTKVYNKAGWDYDEDEESWNCHHDASIIVTESGRHFVVVLMTSQVSLSKIRSFGSMLESVLSR